MEKESNQSSLGLTIYTAIMWGIFILISFCWIWMCLADWWRKRKVQQRAQVPPPNYDDLTPLETNVWTFNQETQQSGLETSFTPPPKYDNLNPDSMFPPPERLEIGLEIYSVLNEDPMTNPIADLLTNSLNNPSSS